MRIKILNTIFTKIPKASDVKLIRPILRYEKQTVYRKPPFNQIIYGTSVKFMVKNQLFFTGFIPRIIEYCKNQNIPLEIKEGPSSFNIPIQHPSIDCKFLKGITFRPEQVELIKTALDRKRGTIIAPARTGKTVIAGGIIASLDTKSVFVVNTRDLLDQTVDEFKSFGFDVSIVGKGEKDLSGKVVVATYQSLRTLLNTKEFSLFGLIIIDECHHIKIEEGSYYDIIFKTLAPFRIGITATYPTVEHEKLLVEGLLGPIIGEITHEEARELKIQAKPKLRLIKIPEQDALKNMSTYLEAYMFGIIKNRARNRLIMKTAVEYLEDDNTVLIIVTRIQHGIFLEDLFRKFYPEYNTPFLCGNADPATEKRLEKIERDLPLLKEKRKRTSRVLMLEKEREDILETRQRLRENSSKRSEYRKLLSERKVKCVIATNIWNEGVNIPSLNVVINAGGSKSETPTIQMSSRSLTACPGKEYGVIVDFFDPNFTTFIDHFGERITTYMELGWI